MELKIILAKQIKKLNNRYKILGEQKKAFEKQNKKASIGSSIAINLSKQIKLRGNEMKNIRNQILMLRNQYNKIKKQENDGRVTKENLEEQVPKENLEEREPKENLEELELPYESKKSDKNVILPSNDDSYSKNNHSYGFSELLKKTKKPIISKSNSLKKNRICQEIFTIGSQTQKNKYYFPSEFPKLTRRKSFSIAIKTGGRKSYKSNK